MKSLLCLFVIDKDSSMTGAPRTVLNLLTGLHRKGLRPVLVTQCESPLTECLRKRGIAVEILPLPPVLNVFDEGIFEYSWSDKIKAFQAVIDYNRRIMQLADEHEVDGIWARQVKGILLAGFMARWTQRPLIWDIGVEKESTGLVYLLHTTGLLLASKIITQARIQPQVIFGELREWWFRSKFEAINPGIDDDRLHRIEQARGEIKTGDAVNIVTVGSVHPRKNQKMLLQVFAKISEIPGKVRVRIVGPSRDETYASDLQRFVEKEELTNQVDFLGWRDDIPDLLGRSDIFVLCSQAEGVPQVIREAMYARLPVVATAVGGVPETVRHGKTGYLVPYNDQNKMKKYLLSLIRNPEKRKAMGKCALQLAKERFSQEEWISSYISVIQSID